jgi:hypothetical protein
MRFQEKALNRPHKGEFGAPVACFSIGTLFFPCNALFRLIALPFERNAAYSGHRAVVFYGLLSGDLAPAWQFPVELPQLLSYEREAFRRIK